MGPDPNRDEERLGPLELRRCGGHLVNIVVTSGHEAPACSQSPWPHRNHDRLRRRSGSAGSLRDRDQKLGSLRWNRLGQRGRELHRPGFSRLEGPHRQGGGGELGDDRGRPGQGHRDALSRGGPRVHQVHPQSDTLAAFQDQVPVLIQDRGFERKDLSCGHGRGGLGGRGLASRGLAGRCGHGFGSQ